MRALILDRPRLVALALLALLALLDVAVLATVVAAQAVEVDPVGPIGAGALAFGLSELVKWAVPVLGSLLFSAWNKANSAIGRLGNAAKAGVYVLLTTALMYVGELIHVAVSPDPANWSGTFWEGIAAGLIGTLLVRIGIGQVRDPRSATRSAP